MIPEMIKKTEDDKINVKQMMNAMITKMIKTWKKYFKDFQCVAGSVLHKVSLKNRVPGTYNLNGLSWIIVDYHGLSWIIMDYHPFFPL